MATLEETVAPDWKPGDSEFRPKRAPDKHWDMLRTGSRHNGRFAYMDRVAEDMFVGRYDFGLCHAVDKDFGVMDTRHAYIVTVTPDSVESVCLYCTSSMEGCPCAHLEKAVFEGFTVPRRATRRELESMGLDEPSEGKLLYLDIVDGAVLTGRFRLGKCPGGGPHEAVLWWHDFRADAVQSACAFCGEQWEGSPPGFWRLVEPGKTVEGTLRRRDKFARSGAI